MRLGIATPRAALIVAPHADDETIGAFGLMRALLARGTAISVIVVTDGAASHRASARWPRARLIRERRNETLRAMRFVGIGRAAIGFLALPDGALPEHAAACLRLLAREVRRRAPDVIVGPVPDDDHADHRIVAMALRRAHAPGARRLGYRVWPIGARDPAARSVVLDTGARLAKRRAIRGYRTQTGRITDDPAGFSLDARQIARLSGPRERFSDLR